MSNKTTEAFSVSGLSVSLNNKIKLGFNGNGSPEATLSHNGFEMTLGKGVGVGGYNSPLMNFFKLSGGLITIYSALDFIFHQKLSGYINDKIIGLKTIDSLSSVVKTVACLISIYTACHVVKESFPKVYEQFKDFKSYFSHNENSDELNNTCSDGNNLFIDS